MGNLPPEATEVELTTLFTQLLSACDGFNPILGPPCPNASIAGGHTFAFVEFRDEQLCKNPCGRQPPRGLPEAGQPEQICRLAEAEGRPELEWGAMTPLCRRQPPRGVGPFAL